MISNIQDSGDQLLAPYCPIIAQISQSPQASQEFSGEDVLAPLPDLTDCLEKIEQRYGVGGDPAIFILSSALVPPFTGVGGTV